MATTVLVIEDLVQADGRRRVKFKFDSGTGLMWFKDVLVGAGVDAQAFAESMIPNEEALYKEIERENAWSVGSEGGDPDLGTYHFNTLDEIRKYFFRRLFNLMRDEVEDLNKATIAGEITVPTGYLNKHNSASIKTFVDDPGWSVSTVNGAKGKISTVGIGIRQLDHGEDELSLDF